MNSHLDLCSGIGGFSLAASWRGMTTVGFCEIDPFCTRVLRHHWPETPIHDNLRTLTADIVRGWLGGSRELGATANSEGSGDCSESRTIRSQRTGSDEFGQRFRNEPSGCGFAGLDLLTAGYPCQPFSHAGNRLGAEDDRHLWPAIAALVADFRPRWCLFENVAGHVSMGLDDVLADLEGLGYAWGAAVIPACAVGAPHRRDRVWIVAHAESGGRSQQPIFIDGEAMVSARLGANGGDSGWGSTEGVRVHRRTSAMCAPILADAACERLNVDGTTRRRRSESANNSGREIIGGVGFKTHGLSRLLAGCGLMDSRWQGDPLNAFGPDWESGVPRVTDHEPNRVNKLKALGNAIVPAVAYVILGAMIDADKAAA